MSSISTNFPEDIPALRQLVTDQANELRFLKEQLNPLMQRRFAASSEKYPGRHELFDEAVRGGDVVELDGLLSKLKMEYLATSLDSSCEQASKNELGYREFPSEALGAKWAGRHQNGFEDRLERQLQRLCYPKAMVLDEMGYLPMNREEASLFFRLISRRQEKASLILTPNKSFADWGEIFGDRVIATALLDRLLHHSTTLNIKGESYRLKERKKAGMLNRINGTKEEEEPEPALAEG